MEAQFGLQEATNNIEIGRAQGCLFKTRNSYIEICITIFKNWIIENLLNYLVERSSDQFVVR